jgi:hypothetical protein
MLSSLKEQDTTRITLVLPPKGLEAHKFHPPPCRPQKLRCGCNLTFVKMSTARRIWGWWRWWWQSCRREPWYSPDKNSFAWLDINEILCERCAQGKCSFQVPDINYILKSTAERTGIHNYGQHSFRYDSAHCAFTLCTLTYLLHGAESFLRS